MNRLHLSVCRAHTARETWPWLADHSILLFQLSLLPSYDRSFPEEEASWKSELAFSIVQQLHTSKSVVASWPAPIHHDDYDEHAIHHQLYMHGQNNTAG